MTAQAGDLDVISKTARRVHLLLAGCLGALSVLLWQHIPESPAAPVEDDAMVAACKLPARDGEMTVFIVEDGKLKCWRWR